MRMIGTIRSKSTSEIVAAGHGRGSAYEALEAQVPPGHVLLRAHFSMSAGVTTATGVIRADRTTSAQRSAFLTNERHSSCLRASRRLRTSSRGPARSTCKSS
ncbi:MAG: hypothetical protein ACRDT9_11170 [Agromyces sp.]